jgi:hypothetical protein
MDSRAEIGDSGPPEGWNRRPPADGTLIIAARAPAATVRKRPGEQTS